MIQIEYLPIVLTGIGIIASILYYASVLKNANKTQQLALETRQAQLFHGVFNKIDDEWWNAFYFIILNSEWTDYSDYAEKYFPPSETELGKAESKVGIVFEYLGVLVKEGLVSIRLVALLISKPTLLYWEKFKPIIQDIRSNIPSQRAYSEIEYLYNELIKYLDEHPELKP